MALVFVLISGLICSGCMLEAVMLRKPELFADTAQKFDKVWIAGVMRIGHDHFVTSFSMAENEAEHGR